MTLVFLFLIILSNSCCNLVFPYFFWGGGSLSFSKRQESLRNVWLKKKKLSLVEDLISLAKWKKKKKKVKRHSFYVSFLDKNYSEFDFVENTWKMFLVPRKLRLRSDFRFWTHGRFYREIFSKTFSTTGYFRFRVEQYHFQQLHEAQKMFRFTKKKRRGSALETSFVEQVILITQTLLLYEKNIYSWWRKQNNKN